MKGRFLKDIGGAWSHSALPPSAVPLSTTGATSHVQSRLAASGTVAIGEIEPDFLIRTAAASRSTSRMPVYAVDEHHAKGQAVKAMATSIVSSQGARIWTIAIKKGWTFQNGEPVTSASFVNSWNATAYGPNAWVNNGQLSGYRRLSRP